MTQNNNTCWSVKMADAVIKKYPCLDKKWSYDYGVLFKGIENVWKLHKKPEYFIYIRENMDMFISDGGDIWFYNQNDYNIDFINNGKTVLFLYKETGEEKYKKAAMFLRNQLKYHPRTKEGGFWHKKVYPHQMWLDGIYMGTPFYAEYSTIFNDAKGFDDVTKQIILMDTYARDPKTGLHYHGWDETRSQKWADNKTGCSKSFWCRAEGWYAMALVDVLDFLPENHKGKNILVEILQNLVNAIVHFQDKDRGVWNQVLNYPANNGNYPEASSSAMFIYTIAKAVRKGYINKQFRKAADQGYKGLLKTFVTRDPDGHPGYKNTVYTSGLGRLGKSSYRDGSYKYYVSCPVEHNNLIGIGSFILASVEIEKGRIINE